MAETAVGDTVGRAPGCRTDRVGTSRDVPLEKLGSTPQHFGDVGTIVFAFFLAVMMRTATRRQRTQQPHVVNLMFALCADLIGFSAPLR